MGLVPTKTEISVSLRTVPARLVHGRIQYCTKQAPSLSPRCLVFSDRATVGHNGRKKHTEHAGFGPCYQEENTVTKLRLAEGVI